ncbi:type IX secretion system sortase PorU [Bacteroidales bacterium OttesenSCG-928-K03]|nr:type IX secretion system sortase PorU [Bacteroidales bacterium OttesenSCG-928-K03]
MRKYIFLLLITHIFFNNLFAQNTNSYSVKWDNSKGNNSYTFPDAAYLINDSILPAFIKTIELDKEEVCKNISISNIKSILCNDSVIANNIDNYDLMFNWSFGLTKHSSSCDFVLHPYFLDSVTNECRIITDFDITITTEKRQESNRILPEKSILSEGQWYRFKILSEGMYCITYDDLISYGVNISNIKTKNIRIFANKGYILPEANSEAVLDNPSEIPILVNDNYDGIFNSGDSIIFYVEGPHRWTYNNENKTYAHLFNFYSDTAHFFLNFGNEEGLRINTFDNSTLNLDFYDNVVNYTKLDFHQRPLINLLNSGNLWFGESFDNNTPDFDVPKSFTISEPTEETANYSSLTYNVLCVSKKRNNVNAIINGTTFGMQSISSISGNYKGREKTTTHFFKANNKDIDIKIRYMSEDPNGTIYLGYANLNLRSKLQYPGTQFSFRDPYSTSLSNIFRYNITNTTSAINVWNITDPLNPIIIPTEYSQNTTIAYYINSSTSSPDEFIAFYNKDLQKPIFDKQIQNQNLFALKDVDYLLIVPDGKFINQAELFGQFHQQENGYKYSIVELDKIYNEFSCGTQDLSSIRNLIRYIYVQSNGEYPKSVLLFGTTNFDFKNIIAIEPSLIPTFESYESLNSNQTYATDDYYVLMDEDEGEQCAGHIDIAIGRIPFYNEMDIEGYFNKVKHYHKTHSSSNGTWKTKFVGVADDGNTEGDSHDNRYPLYFENLISQINSNNKNYLFNKVYIDAFEHKTSSSGYFCPDATDYLVRNFNEGALMMVYYGHGSKLGWAGENLLTVPSIQRIHNLDNMPLVIAITCEYFEYDQLNFYPSAKHLIQSPDGGAVALITTSRISYGEICEKFMEEVLELLHDSISKQQLTAGQLFLQGKKAKTSATHLKCVHLFGDPAIIMNYPDYKIDISSINKQSTSEEVTLDNSEFVNVKGTINYDGKFNGLLNYELYDQPTRYKTYGHGYNTSFNFYIRDKIINKGTVEVIDNKYDIYFRLPNNLNAGDSTLRLQLYAYDTINNITAVGSEVKIKSSGNNNAYYDNTPPEITAYLNHPKFKNYDLISPEAVLFIDLFDESGIDFYGNNIGQQITYILNDDYSTFTTLNSFYQPTVNYYQSGHIEYHLKDLPYGENYITIDSYDIMGNFSRITLYFTVVGKIIPELFDVYVSPNPPVDNSINFYITHNIINEQFDVRIDIYDIMGKKIHVINTNIESSTSTNMSITWNCKTDNGILLKPGVYVYKVTINSDEVRKTSQSNKFFIK